MKTKQLYSLLLILTAGLLLCTPVLAQDEEQEDDGMKPTRPHFESTWLIDNQTTRVPNKGTFEFMIQHRFGVVNNGFSDLFGLYAPSNIRLGFNYTLFDNFGVGFLKGPLAIGFGTTKNNRIQDFNLKFGILEQTRNGRIPVSVTYFANAALETQRKLEDLPNQNQTDRLSYFHQVIVSRRFSSNISLQVGASVSHYNTVEPEMQNDHIAVSGGGRIKFSPQSAIIFNFDQPITQHKFFNPQPNVSLGIEVGTSAHTFQVFITNFSAIVPQRNNVFNQNDPWNEGFLIGFNINRLWAF